MAGQFDVSTQTMAQTQQRMVGHVGDIRSELSQLRGQLSDVPGNWQGDGGTAFVGAQARYESANAKLNSALDEISALVAQAQTHYLTEDDTQRSSLTTAGAGMDVPVPGF